MKIKLTVLLKELLVKSGIIKIKSDSPAGAIGIKPVKEDFEPSEEYSTYIAQILEQPDNKNIVPVDRNISLAEYYLQKKNFFQAVQLYKKAFNKHPQLYETHKKQYQIALDNYNRELR